MAKTEKLNGLLMSELAKAVNREIFLNNALITITYVDCSPDLNQAKVGFSVLPDNMAGSVLRKLGSATGEIVAILKKRLKLRKIPHFIWEFDATEKEAARIERLISDIQETEINK